MDADVLEPEGEIESDESDDGSESNPEEPKKKRIRHDRQVYPFPNPEVENTL